MRSPLTVGVITLVLTRALFAARFACRAPMDEGILVAYPSPVQQGGGPGPGLRDVLPTRWA
jgi:hypothetical protein